MNKRILIYSLFFQVVVIIMTSILVAQNTQRLSNIISKKRVNYSTAFKLYSEGKYDKAYKQFSSLIDDEKHNIIGDYVLYYAAKSALYDKQYENSIKLYSDLISKYKVSRLYPFAEQYKALAQFRLDNYPVSNFFNGRTQKWIKEFVGVTSLREVEDKDIKKEIALELITKFSNREAVLYFNNNYKAEVINLPNEVLYSFAVELYEAGYRNDSLSYFSKLVDENYKKADSTYYMARIKQRAGKYSEASNYFDIYLSNSNNKTFRKLALYYSADNYKSLKNYAKSKELINLFLKEYPRDDYVPRIYNNSVQVALNSNNLPEAKKTLTILLTKFPKSWQTELALKSYLKKAFKLKNKTETYYALNQLENRYNTPFRNDYALSWNMWVAYEFGDTEKKDEYIMKSLLTSKNPFYVKGALSIASPEQINMVYSNNAINLENAKRYFASSNYTKAMESLNNIQFIDYIVTKKEDKITKEARAIAKAILLKNKFVQDFYAKKSENEIFEELSLNTKKGVDRAIALYYYKDYDNAYEEYNKIFSELPKTYPLFYYADKIFKSSMNTKRLMQASAQIGKYFGYPYSENVDLLPDEFREYIYPRFFDEYVIPESKHYKIEPAFVYSIMREESLFDAKARSWVGAQGLMQLMVPTARGENKKSRYRFSPLNLNDPKQNIYLGVSHLAWLFSSENASNYVIVASKYNAGSSRGNRWKREWGTNNIYRTARFIDIEETEYYVERVMRSYEYYSRYYKRW